MDIVLVPVLQLFIGVILVIALLLTAIVFAPVHLLRLISTGFLQSQEVSF